MVNVKNVHKVGQLEGYVYHMVKTYKALEMFGLPSTNQVTWTNLRTNIFKGANQVDLVNG